jgi:hypothetical protein
MSRAMVTGNRRDTDENRGADFYATPYAALPPLLAAEGKRLPRAIWEPACGNGALVVPLRNRGFSVTATDLNDWGCPDATPGIDFLGSAPDAFAAQLSLDNETFGIVTNPPFNIIEPFVERAVALSPYVALLCRLAFLESEGRMNWFPRVGLRRVHIIGERLPMMHRHGYEGPKLSTAGMCFAWFIFERGKRASLQVPARWISWKKSARKFPQTDADDPPSAVETLPLFKELAA